MKDHKFQKIDLGTDFVNENLSLYPLMGGTHYGSGSNDLFGGTVSESVSAGKYTVTAEKGTFALDGRASTASHDSKMTVKRLFDNRIFKKCRIVAERLHRGSVGVDLKSQRTHLFVELTSEGYINTRLEGRSFVFSAHLPEGDGIRTIEKAELTVEISAPTVKIAASSAGKAGKTVLLRLEALEETDECEVCLTTTLECPAQCVISGVYWE